MGASSPETALLALVFSFARFILGILLFTASLPRRDNFALRSACVLVALFAAYVALSAVFLGGPVEHSGPHFYSSQFKVYSLLLLALVVGTVAVYDTNLWTALFCCSAGYTVENLASDLRTALEYFARLGGCRR